MNNSGMWITKVILECGLHAEQRCWVHVFVVFFCIKDKYLSLSVSSKKQNLINASTLKAATAALILSRPQLRP